MSENIPQFGVKPDGECRERPSAYAVVFNEKNELLALKVKERHHLPGGGVDPFENPGVAVMREAMEEAGCRLDDLRFLGKANQYLVSEKGESLNKLGIFFVAEAVGTDMSKKVEDDHEITWMSPEDFLNSKAREFQKWAVEEALK